MKNINTGFIPIGPDRTDYLGGTIPFEVRIKDGQWPEKYITSITEAQNRGGFEPMSCVSHSNCNIVEMQLNYMIDRGILKSGVPAYDFLKKNKYLTKDNKVSLSERFLAKVSNTSRQGNSMKRVADAARHYGYVPQTLWPYSKDINSWNEFYKKIPQEVYKMGEEFNKYFELQYEWLTKSQIVEHLQHAPIQVGTAICGNWFGNEIIKPCNLNPSHAHAIYGFERGVYYKDLDQYLDGDNNVMKRLAWNYKLSFILKLVINVKKKDQNTSGAVSSSILDRLLRKFQIIIVPDDKGKIYLADFSKGSESWKYPINEYKFAQDLAVNKIAHGVTKEMVNNIRTIKSLEEVKYLYK